MGLDHFRIIDILAREKRAFRRQSEYSRAGNEHVIKAGQRNIRDCSLRSGLLEELFNGVEETSAIVIDKPTQAPSVTPPFIEHNTSNLRILSARADKAADQVTDTVQRREISGLLNSRLEQCRHSRIDHGHTGLPEVVLVAEMVRYQVALYAGFGLDLPRAGRLITL